MSSHRDVNRHDFVRPVLHVLTICTVYLLFFHYIEAIVIAVEVYLLKNVSVMEIIRSMMRARVISQCLKYLVKNLNSTVPLQDQ